MSYRYILCDKSTDECRHSLKREGWLRSPPIHIPTILDSGNDNYRLHTSQTLKHTSTAGDQSLGTDSIELSTQPIRIKDFLFLSLGFSPKSTPKDLYYICLTANTLSRSIQSVLFCCVWVFESFCVCVGHCMSLISVVMDDVTLGDLKCYGHASSHNTAVHAHCDRLKKTLAAVSFTNTALDINSVRCENMNSYLLTCLIMCSS